MDRLRNGKLPRRRKRNLKTPAFFLQLGLPSTLNIMRHELRPSFSKALFKPEEFEIVGFLFLCGPKTIEDKEHLKNDEIIIIIIIPCPSF